MTHAETEAEKYERKVFGLNHSRAENIDPIPRYTGNRYFHY